MGKIWRGWKGREIKATFEAKAPHSNYKYRNQLYLVSPLTVSFFSELHVVHVLEFAECYFLEHVHVGELNH